VGNSYEVTNADLGINLPNNIQGGYKYFYLAVSGDNYAENAPNTRKQVLVKGAVLPNFAPYNLGANPTYNTPKGQMQYLATHSTNIDVDGNVFGGRYQWGRSGITYAISQDNNYKLYKSPTNQTTNEANHYRSMALVASELNSAGQPASATNNDKHINQYDSQGSELYNGDWRQTHDNNLWGNGKDIQNATTNGGGVRHTDGQLYQSPVWAMQNNSPVTQSGWRIPTQDEMERLGNYDCDPTTAVPLNISTTARSFDTGKGLTWVRVKDGKAFAGILNENDRAGFAIYKTGVWNAADASYKNGTAN
jgi:hypothetical protein